METIGTVVETAVVTVVGARERTGAGAEVVADVMGGTGQGTGASSSVLLLFSIAPPF